ncbi:hypothetical protein Goari_019435, partial [Gossypium aridum]|nr:hypothetical protein [Gossypium aridum]
MKAFIKFTDEKVWHVVLIGWEILVIKSTTRTPKFDLELKRISKCTTAKEARDIFEIAHKRTNKMKQFKVQNIEDAR